MPGLTYSLHFCHMWVNRTGNTPNQASSFSLGVQGHPGTSCVFSHALVTFIPSLMHHFWAPRLFLLFLFSCIVIIFKEVYSHHLFLVWSLAYSSFMNKWTNEWMNEWILKNQMSVMEIKYPCYNPTRSHSLLQISSVLQTYLPFYFKIFYSVVLLRPFPLSSSLEQSFLQI